MESASEKNVNRKSVLKWVFIIAINVIVALTVVLSAVYYSVKLNNNRYTEKEQTFSDTLDSMGQVAYSYLHTEQVFCDNWANYINSRKDKYTLKGATEFVGQINTDVNRITAHVVDYDTKEGLRAIKNEDGTVESAAVSYKGLENKIGPVFEEAETCNRKGSHLHVTRPFENPATGAASVGFCHNVNLVDENGNDKNAVLIRIIPVTDFYGKWNFPTSFEKAKLALVDREGEFVVRFNSNNSTVAEVDEENLFTYLENYTDYDAVESLKNTLATETGVLDGDFKCSHNKSGRENYYAYHSFESDTDWVFVGYIARQDLNVTSLDTTLAIIVIVGFLVLMVIDGLYVLGINKQLRVSMEELKHANAAKTRFLSSMSHDIRTPMNAIIGMTTIAAKRIDDKKQVEECLHQITRASNHLLTLINDVLDISKVESGKLSMNPTVFSLAELIGNIVSITQPSIKEKEMEFEIHSRNVKYEYIFADELRLNQILINLISNAIKYTPEKGKVLFGLEEKTSDKGQNITTIVFTVSDTGIGISDEFKKNMYDAFTRDIDSRINTIQGAGLGLAITKQMVDMMGGTIEVESQLGEGTTFTVTLDLPIAEKMTNDLILPPMHLLVADDDEVFLESAEDTLASLGLKTDVVSNGTQAVEMVTKNHKAGNDYHCAIVDWKMPDMDGLETVRAIRKAVGDAVPVIIISAYDWTDIEEDAIKAGANGFISKPLFRSTVYNKLNELLNFNPDEKPVQKEDGEDLKGLHLLIAEDNDINWEIVNVMLEFHGITSVRAENGKICVQKITEADEGTFDAILMDVQMPIMNGMDATRAIRASEKEYVKNIPVIAMTADAFAEDIAACKEAGMNGHVAKPLDMPKLIKELRSALKKD